MEDLRIRRGLVIPAAELSEAVSRSSGPGGQHVNKTSTRVTLRWNVAESAVLSERQRRQLLERLRRRLTTRGVLILHASSRSQARNREAVRERLARLVGEALATRRPRVESKPSKRAVTRGIESKKRRALVKRSRRRPGQDE